MSHSYAFLHHVSLHLMLLANIFEYFVLGSLRDLNSECRDMKRALSPLPSRLESLFNDKKYYSSWPISFLELRAYSYGPSPFQPNRQC